MQDPRELNGVVSPPPASFRSSTNGAPELDVGREIDDGTELNLDLSLGIGSNSGAGRVRPAIFRSSSAAVAGKGALSMVERSNSAPVRIHPQVGEMDPNPKPARIAAWAGAYLNPDICRKVEGSSSEANTLAAPHAVAGTNIERMTGIIPSDGNRKRGRTEEESTETTNAMPIVYCGGIEGILYRYTSMHNISILCLCHGKFHTPAEFVKHAGGGDVPNPMRCIAISDVNAAPNPLG